MKKSAILFSLFLAVLINPVMAEVRFSISVHANNVTLKPASMETVTVASLHNKAFNESTGFTVTVAWQPNGNYDELLTVNYLSNYFLAANQSRLLKVNITVAEHNAAFSGTFTYTAQHNGEFIGQRHSTLNIYSAPEENNMPSLGVSDYEQNVTIGFNENKTFPVARIYNEGPVNLTITATWIPSSHASSIQVDLTPNQFLLEPSMSILVYATLQSGSTAGTYTGKIDFDCDIEVPENYTGPITTPSGMAHATFHVGEPALPIQSSNNIFVIVALIVTGVCGGGAVLAWKRRRKTGSQRRKKPVVKAKVTEQEQKKKDRTSYMKEYMRKRRRKQRENA